MPRLLVFLALSACYHDPYVGDRVDLTDDALIGEGTDGTGDSGVGTEGTEAPSAWAEPIPWGPLTPADPPDCIRTGEETSWVVDGAYLRGAVYLDEVLYVATDHGLRRYDPERPEALGPPGGQALVAGPDGQLGLGSWSGLTWDLPGGDFDGVEEGFGANFFELRQDLGAVGVLSSDFCGPNTSIYVRDATGTVTLDGTSEYAAHIAVSPTGEFLLGSETEVWFPGEDPEILPGSVRDLAWDGETWVAALWDGAVLQRGEEGWVEVGSIPDDPDQLWAFGEDRWIRTQTSALYHQAPGGSFVQEPDPGFMTYVAAVSPEGRVFRWGGTANYFCSEWWEPTGTSTSWCTPFDTPEGAAASTEGVWLWDQQLRHLTENGAELWQGTKVKDVLTSADGPTLVVRVNRIEAAIGNAEVPLNGKGVVAASRGDRVAVVESNSNNVIQRLRILTWPQVDAVVPLSAPFSPGVEIEQARAVEIDALGRIWLLAASPTAGDFLLRWDADGWERVPIDNHRALERMVADPTGGVWLGGDGVLHVDDADVVTVVSEADGRWLDVDPLDGEVHVGPDDQGRRVFFAPDGRVLKLAGDLWIEDCEATP